MGREKSTSSDKKTVRESSQNQQILIEMRKEEDKGKYFS